MQMFRWLLLGAAIAAVSCAKNVPSSEPVDPPPEAEAQQPLEGEERAAPAEEEAPPAAPVEPVPQPAPEPEPAPEAAPSEPVAQPAPGPVAKPAPKPAPKPEPKAEAKPAPTPAPAPAPVAVAEPSKASQRSWKSKCASCHGADGKGQTTKGKSMKAPDLTSPAWQAKRTDKKLFDTIATEQTVGGETIHGYKGELSDQEITGLVQMIRWFSGK
jgi:outer membrane biosynthesis protein TonB